MNGNTLYMSQQNVSDGAGWLPVITGPFAATGSSASIVFSVTSLSNDDHTVLFDSVVVAPPSAVGGTVAVGTFASFESPVQLGKQLLLQSSCDSVAAMDLAGQFGRYRSVGVAVRCPATDDESIAQSIRLHSIRSEWNSWLAELEHEHVLSQASLLAPATMSHSGSLLEPTMAKQAPMPLTLN